MDTMLSKFAEIPDSNERYGTGWITPIPDMRDFTDEHPEIAPMMEIMKIPRKLSAPPAKMDLRPWCSDIENQGNLGSCTAHAAVGMVEYFENKAFGKHIEGSRLFVYKTTRNLMGVVGDTGAWLRNTMGALALCGIPDEKYWTYTDRQQPGVSNERYFDLEPSAFVYALANNYEAVKYFCHDPYGRNVPPATVLDTVKKYIALYIPSMFGFYGFPSFNQTDVPGGIPYPGKDERAVWGHAVVAVGYDDTKKIKNTKYNITTTGALLIRNSWGKNWGDKGYGWLPYDYVLNKLALDFWSLLSMEWVNTDQFGFPGSLTEAAKHKAVHH